MNHPLQHLAIALWLQFQRPVGRSLSLEFLADFSGMISSSSQLWGRGATLGSLLKWEQAFSRRSATKTLWFRSVG